MRALALAIVLAAPTLAWAHEVLHEIHPGGAVALEFFESDGERLARAPYQVWAPGDAKVPWQEGRTDGAGWLSFVPHQPGSWRVRVVGDDGHGLEVVVDTAALPRPAPGATTAPGAAFVLRPLLGVLLIGALFGGLVLRHRRKSGR